MKTMSGLAVKQTSDELDAIHQRTLEIEKELASSGESDELRNEMKDMSIRLDQLHEDVMRKDNVEELDTISQRLDDLNDELNAAGKDMEHSSELLTRAEERATAVSVFGVVVVALSLLIAVVTSEPGCPQRWSRPPRARRSSDTY